MKSKNETDYKSKYKINIIPSGKFCIFNVGQGLFYGGRVWQPGGQATFVYDCGVLRKQSHLRDVIVESKNLLGRKPLDVLFVSHFDFDHISGIPQLLKERAGVCKARRIVIPYYTPQERMFLLWKSALDLYATHREKIFNDNKREWMHLIENPYQYLLKCAGAEKITLVLGVNPFRTKDMPFQDNSGLHVMPQEYFEEEVRTYSEKEITRHEEIITPLYNFLNKKDT